MCTLAKRYLEAMKEENIDKQVDMLFLAEKGSKKYQLAFNRAIFDSFLGHRAKMRTEWETDIGSYHDFLEEHLVGPDAYRHCEISLDVVFTTFEEMGSQ